MLKWFDWIKTKKISGASPYSMGPASQGTPTPLLSPAPGGGPQDSMGYSLSLNGAEYSSPMSGSQVCVRQYWLKIFFFMCHVSN